jgi:DNA-directed RNA polymerase subunit RPC12/RpoP
MGYMDRVRELMAKQHEERIKLQKRHRAQWVALERRERRARQQLLEAHGGYLPLRAGESGVKHKCEECGSWQAARNTAGRYVACRVCGTRVAYLQRVSRADRQLYYMAGQAVAAYAAGVDIAALVSSGQGFGVLGFKRAELPPRAELRVCMAGAVAVSIKQGHGRDGGMSAALNNVYREDMRRAFALVQGESPYEEINRGFTGTIPGTEWTAMTVQLYDFLEPRWPVLESVVVALRHCMDQGEPLHGEHFRRLVAQKS